MIKLSVVVGATLITSFVTAQGTSSRSPRIAPDAHVVIRRAVEYLLRAQNPDGSFETEIHGKRRPGILAFAALALAADDPVRHLPALRRLTRYLVVSPDVTRTLASQTYDLGYVSLAVCQLHGVLDDGGLEANVRRFLLRATTSLQAAQAGDGGWNYGLRRASAGHDLTLSVSCLQALRAAAACGIPVEERVRAQAMQYVSALRQSDATYAYSGPSAASGIRRAVLTAMGTIATIDSASPRAAQRPTFRVSALVGEFARSSRCTHDWRWLYGAFYAAQVIEAKDGRERRDGHARLRGLIIPQQNSDGSFGRAGHGRIFATSIAIFVLAAPARRLPMMDR